MMKNNNKINVLKEFLGGGIAGNKLALHPSSFLNQHVCSMEQMCFFILKQKGKLK